MYLPSSWYLFWHGVNKSVWELESVEVTANPLQLVPGRQNHSNGGIQRGRKRELLCQSQTFTSALTQQSEKEIEMEMHTYDLLFLHSWSSGNQSSTPCARPKAASMKPEGNIYSEKPRNDSQIP